MSSGPAKIITWQKGGAAELVSRDELAVVVRSTRPAPPGTPLTGTLASGTLVQIKVSSCKRAPGPEGAECFVIQGRLFNANRALKDELT